MRFVLALVAFVVAAAMMAVGVAEKTVLRPADHAVASTTIPAGAHYAVLSGTALRARPGQQHVAIHGSSTVFAAYGRTSDVMAWLSGERYAQLTVDPVSKDFARVKTVTAPSVAGLTGGSTPDPNGSDLWLDQQRRTGTVDWDLNVPAGISLLIASDGSAPAPSSVSITWPTPVSTPLAAPLIVGGSLLLLVGLVLYVLALVHLRRRRGPRRKPPVRMPKPPAPPRYRPSRTRAPVASRGRRAAGRGVTAMVGLTAASMLLGTSGPALAAGAPSSAPTGRPVISKVAVATTPQQAQRIIAEAARVAAAADDQLDAKHLAERYAGPALTERTADYKAKKRAKKLALPEALPTTDAQVQVMLPEATTGWPRTLFAVVTDGAHTTRPPLAVTLQQQTPRDPYRVRFQIPLEPGIVIPDVPNRLVGASDVTAASTLVKIAPGALAKRYGAMLKSAKADDALFDTSADGLLKTFGPKAKAKAKKAAGKGASFSFSEAVVDPSAVVALSTAASGAIVSVPLQETWTVKPVKKGDRVGVFDRARALSKVTTTTKGIASVYGYQALFSVPAASSSGKVELLGYAQAVISAKEL